MRKILLLLPVVLIWGCAEQPTQPITADPQPAGRLTISNAVAATCELCGQHASGTQAGSTEPVDQTAISGTVTIGSTTNATNGTIYINALQGSTFINGTAVSFSAGQTSATFTINGLTAGQTYTVSATGYDNTDTAISGSTASTSSTSGDTGVELTLP